MEEDYVKIDHLLFSGLQENIDLAFTLVESLGLDMDRVMADFYEIYDFLIESIRSDSREKFTNQELVLFLVNKTSIHFTFRAFYSKKRRKILKLPASVFKFSKIRTMQIAHLGIEKLDEAIANWQDLHTLDLRGNKLKELPNGLAQLHKLKVFNLSSTLIKEFPSVLLNCTALEELVLGYLELGEIPESIAKLRNLRKLNMKFNRLKELPETLWTLTNLECLYMYGNEGFISLNIPEHNSSNLKELDLASCNLVKLPQTLDRLKSLTSLEITNNPLRSFEDYKMNKVTKLGVSNLPENTFTCFENLVELELCFYKTYLHLINIDNKIAQNILKERLKEIGQLVKLESLGLFFLQDIGHHTFPKEVFDLPNLKDLTLVESNLTITDLEKVKKELGQLESLRIKDCPNISGKYTEEELNEKFPNTLIDLDKGL